MKKTLSVLSCTIAVISAISCKNAVGAGFTERTDLAYNLATWKTANAHNYVFHVSRSCFCLFDSGEMAVQVEADTVKSVTLVSTGAPQRKDFGITVDALFEIIRNSLPDGRTTVTYDSNLGYPRSIKIECRPGVADCGFLATASQLVISP